MSKLEQLQQEERQTLLDRINGRRVPSSIPDLMRIIHEKARADTQLLKHSAIILHELGQPETVADAMRLSSVTRLYFGGDCVSFDFAALDKVNRLIHNSDAVREAVKNKPEILEFLTRYPRIS